MKVQTNPKWWNTAHDSAWERTKEAMKRDWDQTKHDFGGDEPDTNQDVDDTVSQAAGKQPIPPRGTPTYEEEEEAHRFGFGSRMHYGKDYGDWNESLESKLRKDWEDLHPEDREGWKQHRRAIQYGWKYSDNAR